MKTKSVNIYRERIYRAQLFIQQNLHRDFRLEEVADASFFSFFHFHRLFSIYAGEGVYAYARRLRLQRAAEQLCLGGAGIAAVAAEASYDSTASFTKAFKALFGETPAAYRERTIAGRSAKFGEIDNCSDYEWKEVEPDMRHLDYFNVVCLRREGTCLQAGYAAWEALEKTMTEKGLHWRSLRKFGITVDTPDIVDDTRVRYDAGVFVNGFEQDSGYLFGQQFGGGDYAVFTHKGSYETLWQTYLGICLGWLPRGEAELRDAFWFDEYLNRPGDVAAFELVTKIHVPVRS